MKKRIYATFGDIAVGDLIAVEAWPLVEVITLDRLDPWPMSTGQHGDKGPIVHMGIRPAPPLPPFSDTDGLNIQFIGRFSHESVVLWRAVEVDEWPKPSAQPPDPAEYRTRTALYGVLREARKATAVYDLSFLDAAIADYDAVVSNKSAEVTR